LIEAGADVNGPGHPIVAAACKHGQALGEPRFPDNLFRIIELLLEHGADATQVDDSGANVRWWVGGDRGLHALLDRHGVPQARSMPQLVAEYSRPQRLAEAVVRDDQPAAEADLAVLLEAADEEVAAAATQCIIALLQTQSYGEYGHREGAIERLSTSLHTLSQHRARAKPLVHPDLQQYFC